MIDLSSPTSDYMHNGEDNRLVFKDLVAISSILRANSVDTVNDLVELKHIIAYRQVRPVFQPIVSLRDGAIHGFETLSRLTHTGNIRDPEELFEKARLYGMTTQVEHLCREKALARARKLNLQGMLFINVCPALLQTEAYQQGFTAELLEGLEIDRNRIVFELTEKTLIDDYALFEKCISHYRTQGYKIAIDDLGEGYAGLKMLAQVTPDYVKLARFMIADIESSSIKQALVEAIACFSKKLGVKVIAEGIERHQELEYLSSIGIDLGQGYLLGRPMPKPNQGGCNQS